MAEPEKLARNAGLAASRVFWIAAALFVILAGAAAWEANAVFADLRGAKAQLDERNAQLAAQATQLADSNRKIQAIEGSLAGVVATQHELETKLAAAQTALNEAETKRKAAEDAAAAAQTALAATRDANVRETEAFNVRRTQMQQDLDRLQKQTDAVTEHRVNLCRLTLALRSRLVVHPEVAIDPAIGALLNDKLAECR